MPSMFSVDTPIVSCNVASMSFMGPTCPSRKKKRSALASVVLRRGTCSGGAAAKYGALESAVHAHSTVPLSCGSGVRSSRIDGTTLTQGGGPIRPWCAPCSTDSGTTVPNQE